MHTNYYLTCLEDKEKMNRFIKVFLVIFSVFMIILVLNVVDQLNTPLMGDWALITTNFINTLPYLILIFLGIFYVSKR